MQGLAKGMQNSLGIVKKQVQTVADTVNDTLDTAFNLDRSLSFSGLDYKPGISPAYSYGSSKPEAASITQNEYNFTYNSPEAINPVKASRLLKQTAQQLAFEFG